MEEPSHIVCGMAAKPYRILELERTPRDPMLSHRDPMPSPYALVRKGMAWGEFTYRIRYTRYIVRVHYSTECGKALQGRTGTVDFPGLEPNIGPGPKLRKKHF